MSKINSNYLIGFALVVLLVLSLIATYYRYVVLHDFEVIDTTEVTS